MLGWYGCTSLGNAEVRQRILLELAARCTEGIIP